ncbi:2-octaprenyl-6-methoxyphenyl hydroxylase [Litorilituus lipolyticus]|uniref:2-octaprenyl-6-methoxyphenyl hydroxylase n=1 Tax=Litorilituus lipolyticus TaxID=2491017 RepID=A0A502L6W2_9GAMM|nr:2-octaprenyl-6-methoxyphenyl hydroxylase [Litorilituus lipolyticus]TPH18071.1 2-octaprenyl-6-methoxyphenyl hydroxylase [Litorilituus lipolyticus]
MAQSEAEFDVIISGGGLSGSLMALSLSDHKKADGSLLSIAIIEANEHQQVNLSKHTPVFDDRVLALSHGSAQYLKQVDVWPLLADKACAIKNIDISDRGHFGKSRLASDEFSVDALGYVIDMALIGKAILQKLADKTNVAWFSPDSIQDIDWQSQSVNVQLSSGQALTAQLLLACDGANSVCRKQAQIDIEHNDYEQVAVIANVCTEKAHFNKAFERFTEHGPIAMLPLPLLSEQKSKYKSNQLGQGRCSLVWTMTPNQAQEITALSDEEFALALEQAFGLWLGKITQVGKSDVYPLALLQAKQQVFHRMALIGNASHTIHPIAGQGFNLGLRDVAYLSELIAHVLSDSASHLANQGKVDIGSFALLQKYQLARSKDQQQVIQLTDSLVTLFASDLPPLVVGRNTGLKLFDNVSVLKNVLVKKTMGY